MKTFEEMLRDFDGLIVTQFDGEFYTPNPNGWVEHWYCRLAYETSHGSELSLNTPVIEFYSLDSNQFISSYYVDTFLGLDQWGNGFGSGLALYGDVPAWTIGADDTDKIREWCVEALRALDGDYPFQLPY